MLTLMLGITLIVIPWQHVKMLNLKRNLEVVGVGSIIRRSAAISFVTTLSFTLSIYYRIKLQESYQDKYFKDVSDKQLVEFDAILQ